MSKDIEQQLIEAQQALATLKAEHAEFSYIVSHDLSAPLRQIEGFSEIIMAKYADSFDDKAKRHFNLVIGGAMKIKELLESLRRYSSISTSTQAMVSFDTNQLVDDVSEQLATVIAACGAVISFKHLPCIVGDRQQLEQVFYQLLHNALLYRSPQSTPKISVTSLELEHHWQFCITDNGIGIRENLMDKIFKFNRRGVSDKQYPGSGAGLAVAKRILAQHQGEIWLESQPETAGSAFYFTIAKANCYG